MDGEELIMSNTSIQGKSTGQAFEFQQDSEHVMEFIGDFDCTLINSSIFPIYQQS